MIKICVEWSFHTGGGWVAADRARGGPGPAADRLAGPRLGLCCALCLSAPVASPSGRHSGAPRPVSRAPVGPARLGTPQRGRDRRRPSIHKGKTAPQPVAPAPPRNDKSLRALIPARTRKLNMSSQVTLWQHVPRQPTSRKLNVAVLSRRRILDLARSALQNAYR